jgi:biotin synthase-related radical SAM superfamily protein
MSHKENVLESLEMMRQCLEETLKETADIRDIAIEEEALIAFEKVSKTCNSALRYARQAERLLRQAPQ